MDKPEPTVKVTSEEFLAGINDEERYKRAGHWNDELVSKDPASRDHSLVQDKLAFEIGRFLKTHPLGQAFIALHCVFGSGWVLAPDAAVVLGQDDEDDYSAHPRAPELAIEVLSPSDRIVHVTRKVDFYLRHGVKVVWLIHMESREATIHTPTEDVRLVPESGALTAESILPGLSIPLADPAPKESRSRLQRSGEHLKRSPIERLLQFATLMEDLEFCLV